MLQPSPRRIVISLFLATTSLGLAQSFCSADPLDTVGFHLARESAADTTSMEAASTPDPQRTSGKQQIIRSADSFLVAALVSYGLKSVVHEERPDHSGNDSFPSTHTSVAFAVAATQSHFHPKQAPYWYGAATLVGIQRVHSDQHHWHDVASGAAIGFFTAKLEVHQKNGLILRPFIKEGGANQLARTAGLSVGAAF